MAVTSSVVVRVHTRALLLRRRGPPHLRHQRHRQRRRSSRPARESRPRRERRSKSRCARRMRASTTAKTVRRMADAKQATFRAKLPANRFSREFVDDKSRYWTSRTARVERIDAASRVLDGRFVGNIVRSMMWLALAACGGVASGADASISDAADEPEAAPACVVIDAANCATGPNVISCESGNLGKICLVDAGDFCLADASCTAYCTSNEYAAACGGIQVSANPPSSACRLVADLPSGNADYCCPCE